MVLFRNKSNIVVGIVIHKEGYRSRNCAVHSCERAFPAIIIMVLATSRPYSYARHSVNAIHKSSSHAD